MKMEAISDSSLIYINQEQHEKEEQKRKRKKNEKKLLKD